MDKISYILSTRSEYIAISELNLLHFIDRYEAGEINVNTETLKECVKVIITEKPSVNDFDEEYIDNVFQVKDYEQQRLILELVYYLVGKEFANGTSKVSISDLDEWGDCMMRHGFYLGYNLSGEDIDRLITYVDVHSDYLLNNVRDINTRNAGFVKYCKEEFDDTLSDDEIISKLNIYNDGAYTELPESIRTIIYYCIENEYYDLLLKLYDILKYAPIQGVLIHAIDTIEQALSLIDTWKHIGVKRNKVFAYLMRNRVYEIFLKQQEILEKNANNKYITKEDKLLVDEQLQKWNNDKLRYIKEFVDKLLISSFTEDEIIKWLSDKTFLASNKKGIYKQREIELIDKIDECLKVDIDIETKDLKQMLYYVSHKSCDTLSKEQCERIINSICEHIYDEDNVYISWKFDDESINQMRAVYAYALKSETNDIDIVTQYATQVEGYKSSTKRALRLLRGHNMWLSIMMIGLENKNDANEFKHRENILFRYVLSSDIEINDYFLLPLLIGEAIAIAYLQEQEKLRGLKDEYEERLITYINDLSIVLCVLTQNGGSLSGENQKKLEARINTEWQYTKSMNPYNPNIRLCDEYIHKYLNQ